MWTWWLVFVHMNEMLSVRVRASSFHLEPDGAGYRLDFFGPTGPVPPEGPPPQPPVIVSFPPGSWHGVGTEGSP